MRKNNFYQWRSGTFRKGASDDGAESVSSVTSRSVFGKLVISQKIARIGGLTSTIILLLLSFAIVAPIYNIVDTAEATVGTATASTLTYTSTNNTASVNLTVNSPDGTFATSESSQKAAFSISTNNYTGYTLKLRSSSTNLTNTNGNTTTNIATLVDSTTATTFASTGESGKALNNRWGYIPNYYNSAANSTDTYYPASTTAATIMATSSANSSNGIDNADTYTIGLGLRADFTNPAGTYTNDTFLLEMVVNPINYIINYNKNTEGTVTNMPYSSTNNQQAGDTSATSIILSSLVPVRDGYNFKGWCFGIVDTTSDPNSCSGTVYNPDGDGSNLSFGIDRTAAANTATIYALWESLFDGLYINYNANNSYTGSSAYFGNESSNLTNTVGYDATLEQTSVADIRYAHTPNIDDSGTRSGDYANSLNINKVISMPGASKLHVRLTYQTESTSYDWVSFWAGNYPSYTASSNYSTGLKWNGNTDGKYGGTTSTTIEGDISGSEVTFAFRSDSSVTNYGYYAVVTGYDANNNVMTYKIDEYAKTAEIGSYATPTAPSGTNFVGWASTNDATAAEYSNESAISTGLAKVNGDAPVTLYPVYTSNVTIKTATGISQVVLKDGNDTVCTTSSTSGTTCGIYIGKSYTLTATVSSGYTFSSWAKSGVGAVASTSSYNTTFTVGVGATTLTPSTTLNSYNITVNFVGGVSSVTFANSTYGTQTVSSSGGVVSLKYNQSYNITVTLNNGNHFVSWAKASGSGTIGSTSTMNTTFTPGAGVATLTITAANVKIATATGISSVTIKSGDTTICTATNASGTYCNLTLGSTYNITATPSQGYSFSSWSHTGSGSIASSSSATTTFRAVQSSAIDVITPSAVANSYTVTVVFGNQHVTSVTVNGTTFTASGQTITLTADTAYTISGTTSLNPGYVTFSSTSNGTVSSNSTGYTIYGDATLTANSKEKIYIQDVTYATCPTSETIVFDRRDEQAYTIRKINSRCWMTRNLAIGCNGSGFTYGSSVASKTLTTTDSNVSGTWSTPTALLSTLANNTSTSGYTTAAMACSPTAGAWYNYAAASAGTITGTYNSTVATKDICPAGWHLPTGGNTRSGSDINDLVGNTTGGYQNLTAGMIAFSPVTGGVYDSGTPQWPVGDWWAANPDGDSRYRMYLRYEGEQNKLVANWGWYRYDGRFVRCVRSS